jgi:ribosomal protein S18 acetylase RimI-like enzyme
MFIRDARPGELDEVAQVLKAAYRQYAPNLPPERWAAYLENIMDVRSRLDAADLIVAEVNGRIAGSVTLYLKPSGAAEEGWPPGWAGIRLLGVHPDFRGMGIGKALVKECIRRSREKGLVAIGLHTSEMMAVAVNIYEQLGFVRVPEYDFHPAPEVVVMAYCLRL